MKNTIYPTELKCEHLISPLAIDIKKPRFSWLCASENPNAKNKKQTAYQILIATSEEILSKNKADIWNTKKVISDKSNDIIFSGKSLRSFTKYFWKVVLWDENNKQGNWSEISSFSTGAIKESDWKGEWLWMAHNRAIDKKQTRCGGNPPVLYRKSFSIKKRVKRAVLYVSALGIYEPYFNGKRLGSDFLSPGWTDYKKHVYYYGYDVTSLIKNDKNAIGCILADGWFASFYSWNNQRNHYGNNPILNAQLVIEFSDGKKQIVATDRTWKVNVGPFIEADFLYGEIYDARKEIPDWSNANFDDSNWPIPWRTQQPGIKLEANPAPPVKIIHKYKPVKITEQKKGVYVVDFGQNISGFVSISLKEKTGKKITLKHAEMLNPDGSIYRKNLRGDYAVDIYYCKGEKNETYQPSFTFHGFQFLEITGLSKKPQAKDLAACFISSDTPVVGKFSCSNKMINKLFSNIYHTQRMNFVDVPTDCPQRDERLGWTGDAQVYIKTAAMITDVEKFFERWLVELKIAQHTDGDFPAVAPAILDPGSGPAWAEAGIICPWVLYEMYEDKKVLEVQYDSMTKFINFMIKQSGKKLLPPKKYHCYGDWLSHNAETPHDIIYTAYFAYSADLMSRIASILGKKSDAKKYAALFENIKTAFNKAYLNKKTFRIKGDTQTCYILAIVYNLVDGQAREKAAEYLIEKIAERNYHLSTGFVGTKDIVTALEKIGRNDIAFKLLLNESYPSWGFSIKHGATTIWERWNGWTPDEGFGDARMNSFAHYAYGAVYLWIAENIGGIRAAAPAFKKIIIKPVPGGNINSAKCEYKSVHGKISTNWKKSKNKFALEVEIPVNTTAEIHFPASSKKRLTENGKSIPKNMVQKNKNGYWVIEVGSGKYKFEL